MGRVVSIPLGTQSYLGQSQYVSAERLLNLYAERAPTSPNSSVVLRSTPGIKAWKSISGNRCRGLHVMGSDLYAVIDQKVYAVDTQENATQVATHPGVDDVLMASNGQHVFIASGERLSAVNRDGSQDQDFAGVVGIASQDGYVLVAEGQSQQIYISELDGLGFLGDFTSADRYPDDLVGLKEHNGEIFAFKARSSEVLRNDGNPDFPFGRVQVISTGLASRYAVASFDDALFFLGDDLSVYRMDGYSPRPVSTAGVVRFISTRAAPASCTMWTYAQEEHSFLVMSWADGTIVFDAKTGLWHERGTHNKNRWRAHWHAYFDGRHIVGDFESGDLSELDLSTYTDKGDVIERLVASPPLPSQGVPMCIEELQLQAEAGVGLEDGSDPEVMMDYSDDHGHTWIGEETDSLGKIGEYDRLPTWTDLGEYMRRTLRFRITDPVPVTIAGARARIAQGM